MRVHLQRQRQRRVAAFAFDVSDITNYAQEQPAKGPPSMSTGTPPPPHHYKQQHNDEPRTGHNDVELGPVRLQGRR